MKRNTVKKSICIPKQLLPKAILKAEKNGQSLSSYFSVLIAADLGVDLAKLSKKTGA